MLPHWFWRVRYRTAEGGGETLVVAPHPAGAKKAIGILPADVTAYEDVEPSTRVSDGVAGQHFDGYYPHIRQAMNLVGSD